MEDIKIPFARPFFHDEDILYIKNNIEVILKSGWLTNAKFVREFESQVAKYTGAKHAIAVSSCTAALHAIMLALRLGSSDEVIVPANTFVATANAVLFVGAKPVIADVDLETYNISPESIQEKITSKTRGIVVVHVGGNPADMKEILEIAEDYNLFVVEDAAHALGSLYQGKCCGTLGLVGAYSFYPTKVITTGEGGMVVTDDDELAYRIRVIRNSGRETLGAAEVIELGHNFRMTELSALLGLVQLRRLDEFIERRNKLAKIYNKELKKFDWIQTQFIRQGNRSTYYAYIITLSDDAPITRDELIKQLRNHNIGTSVIYKPVHLQPFYRKLFDFSPGMLPNAEYIGANNIALPMYNGMRESDVFQVINTIKEIVEGD